MAYGPELRALGAVPKTVVTGPRGCVAMVASLTTGLLCNQDFYAMGKEVDKERELNEFCEVSVGQNCEVIVHDDVIRAHSSCGCDCIYRNTYRGSYSCGYHPRHHSSSCYIVGRSPCYFYIAVVCGFTQVPNPSRILMSSVSPWCLDLHMLVRT